MKKMLAATAIAVFGSVGISAHSTAQTAQTQEAKEQEKIITVSGCLRAGEETGTFVLSNVKWLDKDKGPGMTGTAGTTGADTPPAPISVRLVGTPSGVRMSEHVGHTVEITGFLIDEARPRPSAAPDPVATGTGGDQTSRTQPPAPAPKTQHTLNVRTVKMIEESCSGR